jgi:hypothetical protein
VHGGPAPSYNSIKKWDRHLKETGSAVNQKLPECPMTSNKGEEHIRQTLLHSLLKLICTALKPYFSYACSCGSTSNQLTTTAKTYFVKKCCMKFHLNGINTHNCKIQDSHPPQEINECQMLTYGVA